MTSSLTSATMSAADRELLSITMAPYRAKQAIYLDAAHVQLEGNTVIGRGDFSISQSCYIDDTGHFNAAEFIICYNQLMYFTLAVTVRDRLRPALSHWSMDDYFTRQLPNVLIHRVSSTFSRPIDPRGFTGEFVLHDVCEDKIDRQMLVLPTTVRFADPHGGRSHGDVGLVLTEVPVPSATIDPDHG